jgi:two-component system response regulator FlrC
MKWVETMLGAMAEPSHDERPRTKPWRILVAEDDALLADTIEEFLTEEGFSVIAAVDGRQALERAKTQSFDALLTDLRMPHVDGLELIRRLRSLRPELPVVVMSGNAPSDLRMIVARDGEGPLIMVSKPMRLALLLDALKQVLKI